MNATILDSLKRINALADTGLLYAQNEYDRERYQELKSIGLQLLHSISDNPVEQLKQSFPPIKDYPTAKVDIRGLVLSPDKKILLVKEAADGRWSLPGGWADVGFRPKEIIEKEVKEEAGLTVDAKQLLAVFDKRMHPHPPQPFYVYKMVFYCEARTQQIQRGFDVLDVQYFSIDALPALSEDRILPSQIRLVYDRLMSGEKSCFVD